MKFFSIMLLLGFLSEVHAKSLHEALEKKKYHFSALNTFMKETANKSINADNLQTLERLVKLTGIEILEDYNESTLTRYQTPSSFYVLARRYAAGSENEKALVEAAKIPPQHYLYPEAQMIRARLFGLKGNLQEELKAYKTCANKAAKSIANKDDQYFRMLSEVCFANHARRLFQEKEYKRALDELNRFPKDTYKWPYLLLERAWLYYHLGDHNRSLGLLVTYKAPLLDTYFFPEAEYLAALNYFKQCLWSDSSLIINQYYQVYRPRFTALERLLRENKGKKYYFFTLLFKREKEMNKHEEFIRQIVMRMKKEPRFVSGFRQMKALTNEIQRITKSEKKEVQKLLLPHLRVVRSNLVQKIDNYARVYIFNFLNTVRFFSNELFKLNLEIISRKKDLLYENKKLVADRSRGDYSNVKRSKFEYFWKFEGPFWADELGDYSLGLKSNCATVNREEKK